MEAKRITSENDLQIAFSIREEVFVVEQAVSVEEEFDEFDAITDRCEHILVYYQERPVGTGRVRWVDDVAKLERICILQSHRKFGLGKVIIKALEEIAEEKGFSRVKLHAQTHAEGFYEKLGYQTSSPIFMEACIPHIVMKKELAAQN